MIAASSTMPSREKLRMIAPARTCARLRALSSPRVAPFSGTCRVTKWLPWSTSSIECALRTCEGRLHAASTVISGS